MGIWFWRFGRRIVSDWERILMLVVGGGLGAGLALGLLRALVVVFTLGRKNPASYLLMYGYTGWRLRLAQLPLPWSRIPGVLMFGLLFLVPAAIFTENGGELHKKVITEHHRYQYLECESLTVFLIFLRYLVRRWFTDILVG